MHDINSETNIIDRQVVESPHLLGKECCVCFRILRYHFFRRDSSRRDGRIDICQECEATPRLSTIEHTYRLREMNNSSEAVKRQRWIDQQDYKNDAARIGRAMFGSDFLSIVRRVIPSEELYITDGNVIGDMVLYQVGRQRPSWEDKSYKYICYCPRGWMPEFSQYEFDTVRDIPIKEKNRGWRTVLLRLIEVGLLTEETCNAVFGKADGVASNVWYRELKRLRKSA